MTNYVDQAEEIMREWSKEARPRQNVFPMSTSQIRQVLSRANEIQNRIIRYEMDNAKAGDELPKEIVDKILSMRVKLVYQAGRENAVKEFVKRTKIDKRLAEVGNSASKFKNFFSYLEALVAFHRYYGGKDQ